jgi:hypothetical protein
VCYNITFQDVVQSKKYGKNCFNRVVLYFETVRKRDGRKAVSSSLRLDLLALHGEGSLLLS